MSDIRSISAWCGSAEYWERRYRERENSGSGSVSYGRLAEFKAEVINSFISENGIRSVLEFGSGDGNQLSLFKIEDYTGFDVSETVVARLRDIFKNDAGKRFYHLSQFSDQKAELVLSLDVIYHLIEKDVYHEHMSNLFNASSRYMIIYSSNHEKPSPAPHVRHWNFSRWVRQHRPDWRLVRKIANRYKFDARDSENTSGADFYIYEITGQL